MKKLIICLLLICTMCLGCFALTACDDKDKNPSNEPAVKCEFVCNEFYEYSTEYLGINYHYEWNIYTFRVWYSYSYFLDEIYFPNILCTCPNIISYHGPWEGGIKYDGQCTISRYTEFEYDVKAEYLLGYNNERKTIKPDSWIYFSIRISLCDEFNTLSSITFHLGDPLYDNYENPLAHYVIDLSNTYKTA